MRIALLLMATSLCWGQKMVAARAGMIYYSEGAVTVDGRNIRAGARDIRPQIEDGQTFASPRAHAEILMGPNATLWTKPQTQVLFDNTGVDQPRIAMFNGAAILEIRKTLSDTSIHVQVGDRSVVVQREGVYRFDASPARVRVYGGEISLGIDGRLTKGKEFRDGRAMDFDLKDRDELLYFAAYRSLTLETEAGVLRLWRESGWRERTHAGFGIEMPAATGTARMKYQVAAEAGLVYHLEGSSVAGLRMPNGTRLPFRLGTNNFLQTETGKAEVFLGVGVVARLADDSRMRVVDTNAARPVIALDSGSAFIEVTGSAENVQLKVQTGSATTALLKPGVYRFDVKAGSLSVYAGEAAMQIDDALARAKDGQRLGLQGLGAPVKFDITERDTFYKWTRDRSLALFGTTAGFMSGWQETVASQKVKHKVFGESIDKRRPPPRLRPRAL